MEEVLRAQRVTSSSLCLLEGRAYCLHERSCLGKWRRTGEKVGSPEREAESRNVERRE